MAEINIPEVAQDLVNLIPVVHQKLIRPFKRYVKVGLTPMQIHVLMFLAENNEAVTMTELAKATEISKQQLTPIIDKLIAAGYVAREHDTADRRNIKVRLTAAGLNFLENHKQKLIKLLEGKLEELGGDDLRALRNALIDIHKIVNKLF